LIATSSNWKTRCVQFLPFDKRFGRERADEDADAGKLVLDALDVFGMVVVDVRQDEIVRTLDLGQGELEELRRIEPRVHEHVRTVGQDDFEAGIVEPSKIQGAACHRASCPVVRPRHAGAGTAGRQD
jgi:hypothetical protein